MSEKYNPPFTITEDIANLVIEIAEMTTTIDLTHNLSRNPKLRRENRIHSIHSSLAIEENLLTIEQVSDIIDGKQVLGPPKDIREVQNAYGAYDKLAELNPYEVCDLLTAHRIMMQDLIKEVGVFRSLGAGVYSGQTLIHAGTPPQYVPKLVGELFEWLESSRLHPLIKSCIFHYEFEFIHPFSDGNGRTGRMWHTLILAKWKPFFFWLPIESLIYRQQEKYYEAINISNNEGESTVFVNFMLGIIKQSLVELTQRAEGSESTIKEKLLELLKVESSLSASKASEKLGVSERQIQRLLKEMKDDGLIKRVGSNRFGRWIVL